MGGRAKLAGPMTAPGPGAKAQAGNGVTAEGGGWPLRTTAGNPAYPGLSWPSRRPDIAGLASGRWAGRPEGCQAFTAQDRPAGAVQDGAVNARPTAGGSGTRTILVALAAHAQDAVAVFLAQVGDVGAGGFEAGQALAPRPPCPGPSRPRHVGTSAGPPSADST